MINIKINTTVAPIELGDIKVSAKPIDLDVQPYIPYVLPTASATTKGGVKVGDNLKMTNEVMSVDTISSVEASSKPVTAAAVNSAVLSNMEIEALINSCV